MRTALAAVALLGCGSNAVVDDAAVHDAEAPLGCPGMTSATMCGETRSLASGELFGGVSIELHDALTFSGTDTPIATGVSDSDGFFALEPVSSGHSYVIVVSDSEYVSAGRVFHFPSTAGSTFVLAPIVSMNDDAEWAGCTRGIGSLLAARPQVVFFVDEESMPVSGVSVDVTLSGDVVFFPSGETGMTCPFDEGPTRATGAALVLDEAAPLGASVPDPGCEWAYLSSGGVEGMYLLTEARLLCPG